MSHKTLAETKEYEEVFNVLLADLNKHQLEGIDKKIDEYYRDAVKSKDQEFVGNAHYLKGLCFEGHGEVHKAIQTYKIAQEAMINSKHTKRRLDIENSLGNSYQNLRKYKEGLACYFSALNLIAKESGYMGMKAGIINNIGFVYHGLEDYDNAIKFYLESYQILIDEGMKELLPVVLFNMASSYFMIDDIDSSKKYIEESILVSKEIESELDLQFNYLMVYLIEYCQDGNLKKLKQEASKVIEKIEKLGNLVDLMDAYKVYIKALMKLELYQESIDETKRALPLLRNGEFYEQYEVILDMAEGCYIKLEDYKKAYEIVKEKIDHQLVNNTETCDSVSRVYENYKAIDNKGYVGTLKNTIRVFKLLSKIGEGINLNVDIKGIFDYIVDQIYEIWNLDVFGMAVVVNNEKIDYYYQSVGEELKLYKKDLDDKELIMVYCIQENKEIIIQNTNRKGDYINILPESLVEKIYTSQLSSVLFLPLHSGEKVIGGISIQSRIGEIFTQQDMEMLRTLASYCTSAIMNYERHMRLEKMKDTDGLTGAKNRHAIKLLDDKINNASANLRTPMLLAIYDIDYFKGYNDKYGHLAGDQCLIEVTKEVERILEPYNGQLYRYGGDEFTIMCEDIDEAGCELLLSNLNVAVEKLELIHEEHKSSKFVTISIGAILIHDINQSSSYYYHKMDRELYKVKRSGRNSYKLRVLV